MRSKLKYGLVAAIAALAVAAPAVAQDGEPDAFDGFYVGGSVGYDIQPNDGGSTILFDRNLDGVYNNTVLTGTGANAFAPSATQPGAGFCSGRATSTGRLTGCDNDKDAISYSGRIGFDQQSGAIVVGVVGEFGTSKIRDSATGFSVTPANYVFNRKIDYEGSVRGRIGYAANTTLFYGAFGPSYAKIDSSFSSSQSTNTFTGRGDDMEFGINGGGGIEQKIGRNLSFGLEYMYHRYDDDDYVVRVAGPAGTPFTNGANGGTTAGTDLRRSDNVFEWHSLRATATFRF